MRNAEEYDVIIIGGGATGAGVARDCALRGLRVILLERHDIATGATGRNHGLLHSGARYAVTDEESARECISENQILRRIARHCIEPTGGLFITLPEDDLSWQQQFIAACTRAGIDAKALAPDEARRIEPCVNPALIGAVQVPDGTIDPFRLTAANMLDAREHGAVILTGHEVCGLVRTGDRVSGVQIRHPSTHVVQTLHAPVVVNAAGIWGQRIAEYADLSIRMFPAKGALLDKALKIDHRRTLPKYSAGTFRQWYRSQASRQAVFAEQVAFFHGCFVNNNHPQLGKDLVKVANALGIGVQLLHNEKCCGVPLIANGFFDKAKKQAASNMTALNRAITDDGLAVIATSSTCTFTLRDEYPHLLDIDNQPVRSHIDLATRWLWRKLDEGRTLALKPLPLKVVYHTPCHLEKMGWTHYTLELLRKIPGLELIVLDSQCCGIAGTYGFKAENYATSQAIGAPLFAQIDASGADLAITDCETCKWQIEMSTNLGCEHPVSLLARALG